MAWEGINRKTSLLKDRKDINKVSKRVEGNYWTASVLSVNSERNVTY